MRGKMEMTSDNAMRASDRDRELAAEVLRDAYVAGRIDLEEFHDRTDGAYSARTWGELRDLTADLPSREVLSHAACGADSRAGVARLGYAPRRPFAFIWVMAVIWLAIAGAAHAAAAIPLVLLSLFVLRAARWTMPPEPALPCQAHPSSEGAVQTQPVGATQAPAWPARAAAQPAPAPPAVSSGCWCKSTCCSYAATPAASEYGPRTS
jgi:hypothetical protein